MVSEQNRIELVQKPIVYVLVKRTEEYVWNSTVVNISELDGSNQMV